ncbi:hypothetical protein [Lutibacter sp.]
MRYLEKRILFFLLVISTSFLFAQKSNCKVLKEVINNEYTGKCKNGLASGMGIAKGKYLYEGKFKKGLPHGKGTLKYSSSEFYIGEWKNGLEDGKGKLYYKINGVDSVKVGIWEKGKYIGKKRIPEYKVKYNVGVDRYSFHMLNESNNSATTSRILIKFLQNGTNNTSITNIRMQNDTGNRVDNNNSIGYENIEFPFECKLSYDTLNKLRSGKHTVTFTFIINKPGDWELILNN